MNQKHQTLTGVSMSNVRHCYFSYYIIANTNKQFGVLDCWQYKTRNLKTSVWPLRNCDSYISIFSDKMSTKWLFDYSRSENNNGQINQLGQLFGCSSAELELKYDYKLPLIDKNNKNDLHINWKWKELLVAALQNLTILALGHLITWVKVCSRKSTLWVGVVK